MLETEIVSKNGIAETRINSVIFYKSIFPSSPPMKNYTTWIRRNVLGNGIEGKDYFKEQNKQRRRGPKPETLMFTPEFARSLCLMVKTEKAKKIRFWLFQQVSPSQ